MSVLAHDQPSCSFEHQAFIYDSDDEYVAALVPLVEAALTAGDTVMAVVPQHNAELLQRALGARCAEIELVDATVWYEHPVTTIADYDAILEELPSGARAFVIGEVAFGNSEVEWAAWTRYEAVLNRVLAHHDATVVCPYDARRLPSSVVDDARRTHPSLVTAAGSHQSREYVEPEDLFGLLPSATRVPTSEPDVDVIVDREPRAARSAFAAVAARWGLPSDRVDELTLAVNEVLTNALLHGGGAARLRVWADGDDLICVVDDDGSGIDDVLVGYVRPPAGSAGGYGVWFARRLFERSELRSSPTGGLTVVLATRS